MNPMSRTQFVKVSSLIHPRNVAYLKAQAKQTGQSLSELVNDAVILMVRFEKGEPLV